MKKLIFFAGFLLLAMFLLKFNYGCSKKENDFEETAKNCKRVCEVYNDPKFCERICEIEIFNPRWTFLLFNKFGSAFFYDSKSLSASDKIVKVWVKMIYSEREKLHDFGRKYENLDFVLDLFEINCIENEFRLLSSIMYASDGSIIKREDFFPVWKPIVPNSTGEAIFKTICLMKGQNK